MYVSTYHQSGIEKNNNNKCSRTEKNKSERKRGREQRRRFFEQSNWMRKFSSTKFSSVEGQRENISKICTELLSKVGSGSLRRKNQKI